MDEQFNWYAIYTRPRAEKKVFETLSKIGYEVYLPLLTTVRQWSDRKKKVKLPLIPSYVFIKIQNDKLNSILVTQGIVNILKHLGKPAVIKDYEIENLKILLNDKNNIQLTSYESFEQGDKVIVEKGVFKGLIAECTKLNGKNRVIVRIQGFDNVIQVNVSMSFLKKINNT